VPGYGRIGVGGSIAWQQMRIRWFWWLLALVPALAGFVSLGMGVGDFRSSGMVPGVGLSLALVAILLLVRRPWRRKRGVSGWLSAIPGLMLGLVGLLGLAFGLPEFLEARGLFLDVDDVGPRAAASFNGGYVVVGEDSNAGIVWVSADGVNWVHVEDPILDDLEELRGVVAVDDGLVALGSDGLGEAVILVSSDGLGWSEGGRFGNADHGTVAEAISQTSTGFMVISDTVFNDVEFYQSGDTSSWTLVEPSGVPDDGEQGEGVACSTDVCVGVGSHDATYRHDLEADLGVVWVNTDGGPFSLVDNDFQAERLTDVALSAFGFVVVGNGPDGHGVVWSSSEGEHWTRITGPFDGLLIDGVAALDDNLTIFGRNPSSGDIIIWTSEDTEMWDEEIVADDFPEGSQVRAITTGNGVRYAVGIASETLQAIVWTSTNRQPWQPTATLHTP
jgi:hypothetical protein